MQHLESMSDWVVVAKYPNPWQGNSEGAKADQMIRDHLTKNNIISAVRGIETVVVIVPKPQAEIARELINTVITSNVLRAVVVNITQKYPEDYGTNNPIFWSMK